MIVTSVLQGRDIVITVKNADDEYVPFACGTACTITIVRDKIQLRDRTVGLWKKYKTTELSGTITIDGVVTLFNVDRITNIDIIQKQIATGMVDIICSMTDRYGNEAVFSANVILDSSELNFTMGQASASSIQGTINGIPTITYVGSNPAPQQTYANPYCALEDEDGSYLRDVDGSLLVDGDCETNYSTNGEFSQADFSSFDFFV